MSFAGINGGMSSSAHSLSTGESKTSCDEASSVSFLEQPQSIHALSTGVGSSFILSFSGAGMGGGGRLISHRCVAFVRFVFRMSVNGRGASGIRTNRAVSFAVHPSGDCAVAMDSDGSKVGVSASGGKASGDGSIKADRRFFNGRVALIK